MELKYNVVRSMRRLIKTLLIFSLICSAPASAEGWWLFTVPPIFKALKQWYDSSSKPETKQSSTSTDLSFPTSPEKLNELFTTKEQNKQGLPNSGVEKDLATRFKPINSQPLESERLFQCLRDARFDVTSPSYQLCVKNVE